MTCVRVCAFVSCVFCLCGLSFVFLLLVAGAFSPAVSAFAVNRGRTGRWILLLLLAATADAGASTGGSCGSWYFTLDPAAAATVDASEGGRTREARMCVGVGAIKTARRGREGTRERGRVGMRKDERRERGNKGERG